MKKLPWEKLLSALILIAGGTYLIWAAHPIWEKQWLNDDSFITLTYTKNLINGNGFVYNHPPATLGTTTPLFTLLTAFITTIIPGVNPIASAIILSVAAWIGTGFVLYLIAFQLGFRPLASSVVAIIPLTVVNSTWLWFVGMEIWLFELLLVLTFYLALTNRPALAGVSVGLLFLTRGEGILMGGIVAGYFLLAHKRIPKTFIIGGAAVFVLWAGYALLTFGTILPNTMAAKVAHREFLINHDRDYSFIKVIVNAFPKWLQNFNLGESWLSNVFLFSMILGSAVIFIDKRLRRWSFLLIWGAIYFSGYAIINPSTYPWYALHFYFIAEVMAGLGLGWLLDKTLNTDGSKRILMVVVTSLLTGFLLIPILQEGSSSVQAFNGDGRAPAYKAVAHWLNENSKPEEAIAYLEIGYLGYYSQNRIIDLAGLIDPLIAENIAEHGFTWGFWHYKPEYFLFNPGMDNEAYLADIRSATNQYEEVARFPGGSDGLPLVLFKRIEGTY